MKYYTVVKLNEVPLTNINIQMPGKLKVCFLKKKNKPDMTAFS